MKKAPHFCKGLKVVPNGTREYGKTYLARTLSSDPEADRVLAVLQVRDDGKTRQVAIVDLEAITLMANKNTLQEVSDKCFKKHLETITGISGEIFVTQGAAKLIENFLGFADVYPRRPNAYEDD